MNKYGADGVRMGMMLASPAGNDLPFDESLCEQGRNFNNKIWNALRLVKGWEVAKIEQPVENRVVIKYFSSLLNKTIAEVDDSFKKYRLSEALMQIYKLFWDEFSAWYLEIIKPEYGKPIDFETYNMTIKFFEMLLKLLHPFMPFITEELYHALKDYDGNETIMHQSIKEFEYAGYVSKDITDFEKTKEIITNIRNIRVSKSISPKESLNLQIAGEHNAEFDSVIKKLTNIENIEFVSEKAAGAVSFMVGTTEYAVPVGNLINPEEEIKKMEEEIKYLQGFLKSVEAKLSNEKFVANAKPEIVENERKKKVDAESKIETLKTNINALKK